MPAHTRPADEVAADIVQAAGEPGSGDGETPGDPDEALARFTIAARDRWLAGPREQVRSHGPVRSVNERMAVSAVAGSGKRPDSLSVTGVEHLGNNQ